MASVVVTAGTEGQLGKFAPKERERDGRMATERNGIEVKRSGRCGAILVRHGKSI